MSRQIGAREISEYAQKYNMPLGKDTPLSMEWCFDMADKAYQQGRQDAEKELNEIHICECKKIRSDSIDEFWTEFDKQIKSKGKQTHFYTEFLRTGMNIKEQLKGAEE